MMSRGKRGVDQAESIPVVQGVGSCPSQPVTFRHALEVWKVGWSG